MWSHDFIGKAGAQVVLSGRRIIFSKEMAEGYLKSLTPAEELAAFLSIRAMCLRQAGRLREAGEAFAAAARLAPDCKSYKVMAATLTSTDGTDRPPSGGQGNGT